MYTVDEILNIAFGISISDTERKSQYGQNIRFPIKFLSGTYMMYDSDGKVIRKKMPDFDLPASSVASFQQAKIHSRTRVAGGGTVTEMYGIDDWTITIRGVCMPDESHPQHKDALEQYRELVKLGNLVDSIEVEGEFFDMKNIYRLVISELSFPELVGFPDVHPFEMRCRSDEPLELVL